MTSLWTSRLHRRLGSGGKEFFDVTIRSRRSEIGRFSTQAPELTAHKLLVGYASNGALYYVPTGPGLIRLASDPALRLFVEVQIAYRKK